jgi:hypothetical protein
LWRSSAPRVARLIQPKADTRSLAPVFAGGTDPEVVAYTDLCSLAPSSPGPADKRGEIDTATVIMLAYPP